jgi:hypothetical protein
VVLIGLRWFEPPMSLDGLAKSRPRFLVVRQWLSGKARQHAAQHVGPAACAAQVHAARCGSGNLLPRARLARRVRIQARDGYNQREADINQEIYGLPEWLPALQSALLNESAILFSAITTTMEATPVSSCT